MQCEKCQKRPANVHITQFINGQKAEKHLCEQCAQGEKIKIEIPQFPLYNLNDLLGAFLISRLSPKKKCGGDVCPNCQNLYGQIVQLGRVWLQ